MTHESDEWAQMLRDGRLAYAGGGVFRMADGRRLHQHPDDGARILGSQLPGWEEALDGMQMGQTRIIQVPPSMAYGEKGIQIETKDGSTEYLVPPNEKLQFEITLVQVSLPPP